MEKRIPLNPPRIPPIPDVGGYTTKFEQGGSPLRSDILHFYIRFMTRKVSLFAHLLFTNSTPFTCLV